MLSSERGFFSIDAFFALLLLLTVSGAVLNAAQGSQQIASEASATQEADMVVEKLAATINTVYANGSPFKLRVELPDTIRMIGEEYVESHENYTISLDLENREVYIKNLEGVSSEVARASIIPHNLYDFELGPENLSKTIHVYWEDENIRVSSHE
ncbi:hypothetical protein AKJ42_01660 [candidate division MSBL1 archaeon SCGC-AAA261C02]|uniref:Flagellin n=1 Tax=candidate division MSBL1 archaeon SCGC-AAA261C02 TaxID=1698272 RepID=A0A133V0X2_9EURY|nr:hypothetical protein AKJ42_01660 [candidate division MSBL1 archaeon SCGC-AAA261C02]